MHDRCCALEPRVLEGAEIITICPECDKNFKTKYEGISTISLWEILDNIEG